MIKETLCQAAIDYEFQPDGGKTPVIDAYDGCQFRCPYCFQWRDLSWNKNILVKTNILEVLARELDGWDPVQTLYVGSRSDPYMPLERRYRLTRRIFQILLARGIPCVLSTKSDDPALSEDIHLFRQFGEKIIICVGQANLAHLRKMDDPRQLPNIRTANELIRQGIQTWVFITPVLPGITDVKRMVDALPESTPIFLDKLRLAADSPFKERFFKYLGSYTPHLEPRYRKLMQTGTDSYCQELKDLYRDEPRVSFVFGEC